MIQHLQNYSTFGLENREELEKIGFDLALLEKAAAMSARMGTLFGRKKARDKSLTEAHLIKTQVYTLLKREMRKVRELGKFVFYRDAAKKKFYTSNYTRKINQQNSGKETADDGEAAATA